MSDRSKRVWRSAGRVVGLLAGLLAAIYVGLWVVGLPLVNVASLYEAREMTAGQPSLRLQFEALPDTGRADLSEGAAVTALGYSMRFPWKTVATRQDFKHGSLISFEHGGRVLLLTPHGSIDPRPMAQGHPELDAMCRKVMGDAALRSQYAFWERALEEQPGDLSLWHSRSRNGIALMLLADKMASMHFKAGHLYRVAGGSMRGFEVAPQVSSRDPIELMLFDEKDRRVDAVLSEPTAVEDGVWTQAEVNAVVASMAPPR